MLRARMRSGAAWSDACILNVSSRGLMINAPSVASLEGSRIEVRHGDHMIVATVMWSNGTRAGLQSESWIPVDDILALSQSGALQLTAAAQWPQVDRRKRARGHEQNRLFGRALEFAGVGLIAISLAMAAFGLFEGAFAQPMKAVEAALGR